MLFPGQLQRERRDWRCRELLMVFPLFPKLRLFEDTFLMVKYFGRFEIEQKHPWHVSSCGSSGQQPALGRWCWGRARVLLWGHLSFLTAASPGPELCLPAPWGRGARGTSQSAEGQWGAWAAGVGEWVGAAAVLCFVLGLQGRAELR